MTGVTTVTPFKYVGGAGHCATDINFFRLFEWAGKISGYSKACAGYWRNNGWKKIEETVGEEKDHERWKWWEGKGFRV